MAELEIIEFIEPVDITEDLLPDSKENYALAGIKVFAVSLEYLLENTQRLQNENNMHYYALLSNFAYYSPINLSYDFTNPEEPKLDLGTTDEAAMIIHNNDQILFYVHDELVKQKPSIAYKAYSDRKNLEPIQLFTPVFGINTYPPSQILVPFVLMDFQEILLDSDKKIYLKYGNISSQ